MGLLADLVCLWTKIKSAKGNLWNPLSQKLIQKILRELLRIAGFFPDENLKFGIKVWLYLRVNLSEGSFGYFIGILYIGYWSYFSHIYLLKSKPQIKTQKLSSLSTFSLYSSSVEEQGSLKKKIKLPRVSLKIRRLILNKVCVLHYWDSFPQEFLSKMISNHSNS